MFPNLNAELARNRLNIKGLSEMTGIKYDSLKNKMAGNTEFKRTEMFLIKAKVFPNMQIDYLFEESQGQQSG
jgi:hypothetical protein